MKKLYLLITCIVISLGLSAQLKAPNPVSPVAGASVVPVNTKLIFSASIGGLVSKYEAQISLDSAFFTSTTLTLHGTAALTSELKFNTLYYWRVRAYNTSGIPTAWKSSWFTTFDNQFTGFNPLGPGVAMEAFLQWDTISGIVNYDFQMDTSSSFTAPVTGSVTHPTRQVKMSQLRFNTTYYWRIRARHSKDTSNWSATKSIATLSSITLKIPINNVSNQMPATLLSCSNVAGVDEYLFQIDASTAFDTASTDFNSVFILDKNFDNGSDISWTAPNLKFGQKYHWRVRGRNSTGYSNWSSVRSFTVRKDVKLISPGDGSPRVPNKQTLKWEKVTGADFYEVNIDTVQTFTQPITKMTVNDTSNYLDIVLTSWTKTWNWRVRAIHTKSVSDWSEIWSFSAYPLGIDGHQVSETMNIYPNPAHDFINLENCGNDWSDFELTFFDANGKEVRKLNYGGESLTEVTRVDIRDLKGGMYLMVITNGGVTSAFRIVKE